MSDTRDAMQVWLMDVQSTNLSVDQVMNPARVAAAVGDTVKNAGGGQIFDAEPQQYYKLIRDLAPPGPGEDA